MSAAEEPPSLLDGVPDEDCDSQLLHPARWKERELEGVGSSGVLAARLPHPDRHGGGTVVQHSVEWGVRTSSRGRRFRPSSAWPGSRAFPSS